MKLCGCEIGKQIKTPLSSETANLDTLITQITISTLEIPLKM